MKRGIRIGPYHTSENWDLLLTGKSISKPVPKTLYINIPGRDGSIDLSEELAGEIKYENRTASFSFILGKGDYYFRESILDDITEKIHGRVLQAILDDDLNHYYYGRFTIAESINNKSFATIRIDGNCEPWRYSVNETVRAVTVNNSITSMICSNRGIKTIIPEAEVTGNITISFNGQTLSLTDGKHKLSDLKLKTGSSVIIVEGSGTLALTYREGML